MTKKKEKNKSNSKTEKILVMKKKRREEQEKYYVRKKLTKKKKCSCNSCGSNYYVNSFKNYRYYFNKKNVNLPFLSSFKRGKKTIGKKNKMK